MGLFILTDTLRDTSFWRISRKTSLFSFFFFSKRLQTLPIYLLLNEILVRIIAKQIKQYLLHNDNGAVR